MNSSSRQPDDGWSAGQVYVLVLTVPYKVAPLGRITPSTIRSQSWEPNDWFSIISCQSHGL